RLGARRGGRRAHRRRGRESRRRLPRSLRRRRHQGFRPLRPDDHRLDGPAVRPVRQTADRAGLAHDPEKWGPVFGKDHAPRKIANMFYRESGVFKTTYATDMALYPLPITKWAVAAVAVLFVIIAPLMLGEYLISILNLILIAGVGALGLNILVGYTGQVSI